MLPTAATALSAAQLAHVFENGAILSSLQAVCELQSSTHFYAFIFMPVPAAPRQRPGNVPATSQQRPNAHERASGNSFAPSTFLQWFVRAVLRAHAISC